MHALSQASYCGKDLHTNYGKACKQRHVKCDERRPSCINCITADRVCSFLHSRPRRHVIDLDSSPSLPTPPIASTPSSLTPSSLSIAASPPTPSEGPETTSDNDRSGAPLQSTLLVPGQISLQHLVLLHHLENEVLRSPYPILLTDVQNAQLCYEAIFKSAVSAPYLMYELLAFSALHCSTLSHDDAGKMEYTHLAAELQARALALFNVTKPEVRSENCMALLVFSSVLGMHTLFDAVASYKDVPDFLDKIIHYLKLHRGVRAITNQSWDVLRNSEIEHCIDSIESSDKVYQMENPANECDRLSSLLDGWCDKLNPNIYNTCHEAVQSLHWAFSLHSSLSKPYPLHITLAWPVMISIEFIELLDQRQPVPMIILAHWAMLLHSDRKFWVFGDAGRVIVESISRYVGPYWDDWLVAPKEALSDMC